MGSVLRYFLDFTDTGELLRDYEGMELVDLEAARMEFERLETSLEMLREKEPRAKDHTADETRLAARPDHPRAQPKWAGVSFVFISRVLGRSAHKACGARDHALASTKKARPSFAARR